MLASLVASRASVAQDAPSVGFTPAGAAEYARLTHAQTTLPLTADDIRATGRRELDRVHAEIRTVMAHVGFEGSLEAFFDHLRTDDQFYYPDTDEGRAAYLAEARRLVGEVETRLPELIAPPADLTPLDVAPTPPGSAPVITAAYTPAGMRTSASAPPRENGMLMFNLADMRSAPRYQLPVIAYHEGLPGHHLQLTIERARLRREPGPSKRIPAYTEGWAGYAMQLPFALGINDDPYADVGRLGLLSWSAARLVADVGLHVDGWMREEAVTFLLANTPLSERQAGLEIDRCMARPAGTNHYLIGLLTFSELRARAEAALGDDFDLRAFHDAVLRDGPMTLPELEATVDAWIAERAAG